MKTSVIGYPRIGKDRELKFASEKFFNGELEILLVREGGGDEEEENRYEILALGADTLCYKTIGKPRDEEETFEYNRFKEKPKVDLRGLQLEDTQDEFNKI